MHRMHEKADVLCRGGVALLHRGYSVLWVLLLLCPDTGKRLTVWSFLEPYDFIPHLCVCVCVARLKEISPESFRICNAESIKSIRFNQSDFLVFKYASCGHNMPSSWSRVTLAF